MSMKNFGLTIAIAAASVFPPKTELVAQDTQPQIHNNLTAPQDTENKEAPRDGEIIDGMIHFPQMGIAMELKKVDSLSGLTVNMTQQQFDRIIELIGLERTIDLFNPRKASGLRTHKTKYLVRDTETGELEYRAFSAMDGEIPGELEKTPDGKYVITPDGNYIQRKIEYSPAKLQDIKRPLSEKNQDFERQTVVTPIVRFVF